MQARAMIGSARIISKMARKAAVTCRGQGASGSAASASRISLRRLERRVEELEEALLLAGEVLVEGLEADPGALDDQLDGDGVVAALGDQLAGGTEDALALVLFDALACERRRLGQRSPRSSSGERAHRLRIKQESALSRLGV